MRIFSLLIITSRKHVCTSNQSSPCELLQAFLKHFRCSSLIYLQIHEFKMTQRHIHYSTMPCEACCQYIVQINYQYRTLRWHTQFLYDEVNQYNWSYVPLMLCSLCCHFKTAESNSKNETHENGTGKANRSFRSTLMKGTKAMPLIVDVLLDIEDKFSRRRYILCYFFTEIVHTQQLTEHIPDQNFKLPLQCVKTLYEILSYMIFSLWLLLLQVF